MSTLLTSVRKIRETVHVYRHDGPMPEREHPNRDVELDWVDDALIDDVVAPPGRRERFRDLLRDGHSGLLAHRNGAWISYGWICAPSSSKMPLHVPDWVGDLGVYWTFYDRTKREYRRRGWHASLLAARLRAIYDNDPDAVVYTDAAADNVSRYSMISLGFEPAGTLTTYRLGHPRFALKKLGRWDRDASHPPLPE